MEWLAAAAAVFACRWIGRVSGAGEHDAAGAATTPATGPEAAGEA
ncbi:hypothetical protein [Paraburkholderia sp. Tr-20389]|nr:hypothetical protein [Paraburkholderia sp. Tr-20389]